MDGEIPILSVEHVDFAYPGAPKVINNLDFQLFKGEKVGLTGHNGAGKTTFFHLIMGLLRPTAGVIRVMGEEARTEKDFRRVRRRVGFLFQDPDDQLFCPTVLEDVAFGPLNLGKSAGEAREISRRVLADLGLGGYEERVTHCLSGGEKRLVSLATVLAMEPDVLLLDEPTNALHVEVREELIGILNRLDVSYVAISHDETFLRNAAQKLYLMRDGQILPAEGQICCCLPHDTAVAHHH